MEHFFIAVTWSSNLGRRPPLQDRIPGVNGVRGILEKVPHPRSPGERRSRSIPPEVKSGTFRGQIRRRGVLGLPRPGQVHSQTWKHTGKA